MMIRTLTFAVTALTAVAALSLPHISPITLNPTTLNISAILGTTSQNATELNYGTIVENCPQDYTVNIHARALQARSLVLEGKIDTVRGTQSIHGFSAMFKNFAAIETVQEIYEAIYTGSTKLGLKPATQERLGPRFACVTEDSADKYQTLNLGYDPWERCLAGSPRHNPVTAFYAEDTAYIFLCPAYFNQEVRPLTPHCPAVHNDRFAGDPNVLYKKWQVYTLIYQYLRFYLGENALDANTDPAEQLDWNECVRLSMLNSLKNPTNLQLYVALVSQECTDIPEPPPNALSSNMTQTSPVALIPPGSAQLADAAAA